MFRKHLNVVMIGGLALLFASSLLADSLVWTDEVTEHMPITHVGFTAVDVSTHNGQIDFRHDMAESYVIVTKKAGGWTKGAADRALDAIEIVAEEDGDTFKLDWKWGEERRKSWQANVSFEIHAPGTVAITASTHNGKVRIAGARNSVEVEAHNGEIDIESSGPELEAEAHNGAIAVAFSGKKIELETHNGSIDVDLSGGGDVGGSIETHNGSITINVGGETSTKFRCSTSGGAIHANTSLSDESRSKRKLSGSVGDGGGKLRISTHNGSITIADAS